MEKISRKIVQCIDENITLDNSQKEIINFGLQATLEISLNLLISILVLFELHMIKEGVVFFLVFICCLCLQERLQPIPRQWT